MYSINYEKKKLSVKTDKECKNILIYFIVIVELFYLY